MMQRIVYAPNVHQGGGSSLLLPLLESVRDDSSLWLMLDARLQLPERLKLKGKIIRVTPSLLGRLLAEWWLKRHLPTDSCVLAMGNLPPLLAHCGEQWVFIQNRYLIDPAPVWDGFPLKVRLRLMLERWWLHSILRPYHHVLVQTPSMQATIHSGLQRQAELMPFTAGAQPAGSSSTSEPEYDFLYVATGEPHKNHRNLVEAWVLLARQQHFPSLALTLDAFRFPALCQWIEEKKLQYQLKITLLGECAATEMPRLYASSRALIYPSRYESFGLPLLEAVKAGLPVLAANEPYVADVVKPTAVFDAAMPQSIATEVSRFSYGPARINIDLMTAGDFLKKTLYRLPA